MFHTGGMPAVVQSTCATVIDLLHSRGARDLAPDLIDEAVAKSPPISDHLYWFDRFASPLERILAYYAAPRGTIRKAAFLNFLRRTKPSKAPTAGEVRNAFDTLVFANVFQSRGGASGMEYSFAVEAFRNVIIERIGESPWDVEISGSISKHEGDAARRPDNRNVFVCYAHRDNEGSPAERWLDKLLEHLRPLGIDGRLSIWSDRSIDVGARWREEIQSALQGAAAAILLVSPAFLASDYIRTSELPVLLTKARERGTVLLPIVVRPCLFEETRFKYPDPQTGPDELSLSSIQAANNPQTALSGLSLHDQDTVFVAIAQRILSIMAREN